jgi:hypothetical protein
MRSILKSIILLVFSFFCIVSFAQTKNNSYPVIINEDHGTLTLIRVIHKDAFQEGIYKVKLGKENWIEYRNSGDSILFYSKYAKGYKYLELGTYKLRVLENDKIMLQSQAPPYSLRDTVLTHYAVTKTGSWFYFNKSGKVIKQEYFNPDMNLILNNKK